MMNFLFTTLITAPEGNEIEVDVEFDYTPGDPGQLYGPPEDCWPPEPAEVEICDVIYDGVSVIERLCDMHIHELEAKCFEYIDELNEQP